MIPSAVIFDWAGTLVDPGCRGPVKAFQNAFAELGVKVSETLVRRDMGLGKHEHAKRLLTEPIVAQQFQAAHSRPVEPFDVELLYHLMIRAMVDLAEEFAEPVPGAAAVLADLRRNGVKIGSTTGYSRSVMSTITPVAAQHGIVTDFVICADEVDDPRPGPGQIIACLAALGIAQTNRVIKVDDSVSGLMAGRAAGCVTIAVTQSGNPISPVETARWADYNCPSVAELGSCIAVR